ncbi:MAG: M13 family peptidase [Actinobacteria bacterium]|nr:M13 family peptidase [Actinomycetota bacterium]MCB8996469.1 M13 family peptidase [Actinomycetota bacterium]HRY08767.1 M13-type metalloendopeptidase [Candidatus Nanopelagicales bacterium]
MTLNLQWQDSGVRPQDDFYRHWLGKWLDTYEIPEDKAEFASFTELHDTAQEQLRAIIERLSAQSPDPHSNAGRIAVLFNAFMDLDAIDVAGLEPIADLFALVDQLDDVTELPALFGRLEREGVGAPIGGAVHQDNRDSTRYVLDMWQSGLGLPDRDYYLEDNFASVREAYLEHVGAMLERCGVGTAEDAQRIVNLETRLAQAHWTQVANRDPVKTYNQYRLVELSDLTPGYDWDAYLRSVGVIDRIDTLNIAQPDYAQAFVALLDEVGLEDWRPYLRWRILSSFTGLLSEETVQASFDFYGKVLRGVPQMRPRWKRGVDLVEGMVGEALGQEYVAEHFPPEHKARMLELVDNLLQAFEQSIDGLDWMTDQTKEQAHAKLTMFTAKIGYPDVWKDYSDMRLVPGDLIASVRAARQWHHDYEVNKLGGPVDRHEWHMNPQTVNAYYNPEMNEIVFPAAILQPPFFTMAADDAVNYGAIGAVIGHEISHGFDDQGCQFDGSGNLRNWWSDSDHEAFSDRTRVLVEQYATYEPVAGYHLNGELTLGENIADVSGLAVAYRAYQLSLGGEPAPVIDGLTGEQRFFVGFTHVWRAKTRPEETIRRVTIDPHSPPEYRVFGTLVNTDAFFEAFGVKPGDGMWRDPADRVRIW